MTPFYVSFLFCLNCKRYTDVRVKYEGTIGSECPVCRKGYPIDELLVRTTYWDRFMISGYKEGIIFVVDEREMAEGVITERRFGRKVRAEGVSIR